VKAYLILLKRELKSITKEKTIMFAIVIQFFIASFSSIILVGIMAFYDPSSISDNTRVNLRMGLVSEGPSPMQMYLRQRHIGVKSYNDLNAAEEAFRSGEIDAILNIPEPQAGVVDMQLVLPELDTQQTVVLMLLQEPLKSYEKHLREENGIRLSYSNSGGKPSNTFEFLYTIIIPVLMLFPALIAGSIMIDTVSEEFENRTFDTLMAAPVSLGQIFAAKISAAIITSVIQVILWTLLLRANGLFMQNPLWVLLMAVMVALVVGLIAATVALYFKDRERSQFVYSIMLIILVAGSYFIGASPISLIAKMASGVQNVGIINIISYVIIALIMGGIFFKASRRLVFSRQ
jgi:ABC-2 type transport system permease protein